MARKPLSSMLGSAGLKTRIRFSATAADRSSQEVERRLWGKIQVLRIHLDYKLEAGELWLRVQGGSGEAEADRLGSCTDNSKIPSSDAGGVKRGKEATVDSLSDQRDDE